MTNIIIVFHLFEQICRWNWIRLVY